MFPYVDGVSLVMPPVYLELTFSRPNLVSLMWRSRYRIDEQPISLYLYPYH
jgi:hypothetical protein